MGGPPVGGGSIPLPRISGFSEVFFFSHKITPEDEHIMSSMLGNPRFQKGNRAVRAYANLVVLFRMLLYYAPLKHHARFWEWAANDWGIANKGTGQSVVRSIASFYTDARYAALGESDQKPLPLLLIRLVDEWLVIRPRSEIACSEEVEQATIQSTRAAWLRIRDYHVDMLMDSKLPASLAGVARPAKMVTSLDKPDPELVALLKGTKTTRKPKHFLNKTNTAKSPAVHNWPASLELERKRKAPLSEGEIDESEYAPSNYSALEERREPHSALRGFLDEYFAAQYNTLDLIDLESSECRTPALSNEPVPQQQQQQPLIQLLPAPLVQSKPTQSADTYAAVAMATTAAATAAANAAATVVATAVPDRNRNQELSAQLRRVAGQSQRRQVEIAERIEAETTGCVPVVPPHGSGSGPALGVAGGLMAAEERELYESRLRELEARVAALERAHRDEASWSRAMGGFLYDANNKSLKALRDIFSAIETLQKTSAALLESPPNREE